MFVEDAKELPSTRIKDLSRQTFGRLTVLSYAYTDKTSGRAYWDCECSCGTVKVILGTTLTRLKGNTSSCGCLRKEKGSDSLAKIVRDTTPSLCSRKDSYGNDSKEFSSYKSLMKKVEKDTSGILKTTWKTFKSFGNDMGLKPFLGAYVGRIDPQGAYSKENCLWVTMEQLKNKEYYR